VVIQEVLCLVILNDFIGSRVIASPLANNNSISGLIGNESPLSVVDVFKVIREVGSLEVRLIVDASPINMRTVNKTSLVRKTDCSASNSFQVSTPPMPVVLTGLAPGETGNLA